MSLIRKIAMNCKQGSPDMTKPYTRRKCSYNSVIAWHYFQGRGPIKETDPYAIDLRIAVSAQTKMEDVRRHYGGN